MATSPHDDDKDRLDQAPARPRRRLRNEGREPAGPSHFGGVPTWVGLAASLAVIALEVIVYNASVTKSPPVPEAARELRLEDAKIVVLSDPEAAAAHIAAELKRLGVDVRLGHNAGNPTMAATIPEDKNNAVNTVIKPYTVPPNSRLAFEFRKTASGK